MLSKRHKFCSILYILSFFQLRGSCISVNDPRLRPGHLQPLGSQRTKLPVETAVSFPSPVDFFSHYVDKQKPLVIRGGARNSRAFMRWNEEYMMNLPGLNDTLVAVELTKKENRSQKTQDMHFKDFLSVYKNKNIYLVDVMPEILRKDIVLPSPLRCSETSNMLEDLGLWYSSGFTASTLHGDDQDDIRCVLRGKQEYLVFDFRDHATEIGLDRMTLKSRVDVDRVDFEKFPRLSEIKFYSATLEEGDCLYTPYRWLHQIRSYPDKSQQCIAFNIWFNHVHNHRPTSCDIKPEEATMDKFSIQYDKMQKEENKLEHGRGHRDFDVEDEGEENSERKSGAFAEYQLESFVEELRKRKNGFYTTEEFIDRLKRDTFNAELKKTSDLPESFYKQVSELVRLIDSDNDGMLSLVEFKNTLKNPKGLDRTLVHLFLRISLYVHDFVEFKAHGGKIEEFDKYRKERIEERKHMYSFKEEL